MKKTKTTLTMPWVYYIIHIINHTHTHPHTHTHTHTHTHARTQESTHARTHTHTRLTALFPGLPRWAGTRKVKPIWILLKQETVSSSGIRWVICKFAPHSRQITTPAPHRSVFYNSVKALKAILLIILAVNISDFRLKSYYTTCTVILYDL